MEETLFPLLLNGAGSIPDLNFPLNVPLHPSNPFASGAH